MTEAGLLCLIAGWADVVGYLALDRLVSPPLALEAAIPLALVLLDVATFAAAGLLAFVMGLQGAGIARFVVWHSTASSSRATS